MKRTVNALFLLTLAMLIAGIPSPAGAQDNNPLDDEVQVLVPEVISVRDHDPAAFTQGLLFYDGLFYESAGQYGESTLRQVDPETGEVLKSIDVPEEYFAEGLERVGDHLIQLTWKEHTALIYDLETFEQVGTFSYDTEGWGLCYDGTYLYMSDGSSFLSLRDPETFEPIFFGMVSIQGQPVVRLNELECVGDYVWANVWQTDVIVKINKLNGVIVGVVDASSLLTEEERAQLGEQDVLNGIAYNPDTDTFLITGKRWPKVFEVRFVEQPSE
jgi:glutaminyl-peptide cyclotransferase